MKKGIVYRIIIMIFLSFLTIQQRTLADMTEFPVSVIPNVVQESPAIYGNIIVWQDKRNGNYDIYGYHMGPDEIFGTGDDIGEFQITTDGTDQTEPTIYSNIIVWRDYRNYGTTWNYDIYGYHMGPDEIFGTGDDIGEFQITTDTAGQFNPAIWGNIIVWTDLRNGAMNYDIYGYDLGSDGIFGTTDDMGEFQITTNTSKQENPAIYENIVVWQDSRNFGYYDIYGYDLSTKTEFQIISKNGGQTNPAIYGNVVVWEDDRNSWKDIYCYNLSTQIETQITTQNSVQSKPSIYGNYIVWEDYRNGNYDIYGYDLSAMAEFQIETETHGQSAPVVYGSLVVWKDQRNDAAGDIYGGYLSFTPPPAPLLVSPTNSKTEICNPVSFDWNDSVGSPPVTYQIQLSRSETFDTTLLNQTGLSSSDYIFTETLSKNIQYYWRVRATDANGVSEWSETWSFTSGLCTNNEFRITTNAANQFNPDIYGNIVIWEDYRNGSSGPDIFGYDIGSDSLIGTADDVGEFQITAGTSRQQFPSIYQNVIVWVDNVNENSDIYGCTLPCTTTFPVTIESHTQGDPDIYGNVVVWADWRNGNADIYGYDFSTSTEFQITTDTSDQFDSHIYESIIVWTDKRNGYDIYGYNMGPDNKFGTGDDIGEFQMTTSSAVQEYPDINGTIIIWEDSRNGGGGSNIDIYGYDLGPDKIFGTSDDGGEFQIATDVYHQRYPAIYGDYVVWEEDVRTGNNGIYGYIISTKTKFHIKTNIGVDNPAIYGNVVVWQDYVYDVYGDNIFSAPPSVPTPVYPLYNQADVCPLSGLAFDWTDSSGLTPLTYQIQLSTSETFDMILYEDSGLTVSGYTYNGILSPSMQYFWHINSTNVFGTGEWSDVWSFSTGICPPPSIPVPTYPLDDQTNVCQPIAFNWSDSTGHPPITYQIQLSTSNTFETTIFDKSGLSSSSHTYNGVLFHSTTFFWRVRATDTKGTSDWSTVLSFMSGECSDVEFQITSDDTHQFQPAVYENILVWRDGNGDYDILGVDLTTAQRLQIATSSGSQENPTIWGNNVVWEDDRNSANDLFGYDLSNLTEFPVSTSINSQESPAIHGNIIVWTDSREGNSDIYGYDMGPDGVFGTGDDIGEIRITSNLESNEYNPSIYGSIIVWEDARNSYMNHDIYGYDMGEDGLFGTSDDRGEFAIATYSSYKSDPKIFGNTIVWQDNRNGPDIFGYDMGPDGRLKTTDDIGEFRITTDTSYQVKPAIFGRLIVWEDQRNGKSDIYGYDLGQDERFGTGDDIGEFRITTNSADQIDPTTFNNFVAWSDNRNGNWDIYGIYIDFSSYIFYVPYVVDTTDFRSNIGLSNVNSATANINVCFYGNDGVYNVCRDTTVPQNSYTALNNTIRWVRNLGETSPTNLQGYVRIVSDVPIHAVGGPIDNVVNDPSLMDAVTTTVGNGFTPIAQKTVSGSSGTWSDQIVITNMGTTTAHVTLYAYPSGGGTTPVATTSITIGANAQWRNDDLITYMGIAAPYYGMLSWTTDQPMFVFFRLYSTTRAGGIYPAHDMSNPGYTTLYLPFVVDTTDFRSNLGLSNVNLTTANINVCFYGNDGVYNVCRDTTVPQNSYTALNNTIRWVRNLGETSPTNLQGYVKITSDVPIHAVGGPIDNVTNDPSLMDAVTTTVGNGFTPIAQKTVSGSSGTWSDQIVITNMGTETAHVTLYAYPSGGGTTPTATVNITINANAQWRNDDLITYMGIAAPYHGMLSWTTDQPMFVFFRLYSTTRMGGIYPGHGVV